MVSVDPLCSHQGECKSLALLQQVHLQMMSNSSDMCLHSPCLVERLSVCGFMHIIYHSLLLHRENLPDLWSSGHYRRDKSSFLTSTYIRCYAIGSCLQIKGHHYPLPAFCQIAPSHHIFSLEAIIEAGLGDYFNCFLMMSSFEDELCCVVRAS
jgi:hypothetical protein